MLKEWSILNKDKRHAASKSIEKRIQTGSNNNFKAGVQGTLIT